MARLILVRHGETVWHENNRYAGASDIELNDEGHEQAEALAGWAATADLDALWHSPLIRARSTAMPTATATGLDPVEDKRLREVYFGEREGQSMDEIEADNPQEAAAFQADPVANHWPGGEDPRDAAQRATACLHDIARTHPEGRVLIVAHNTLLRLSLCTFMGIPLKHYRTVFPAVQNGALTQLRMHDGTVALLQYNAPLS